MIPMAAVSKPSNPDGRVLANMRCVLYGGFSVLSVLYEGSCGNDEGGWVSGALSHEADRRLASIREYIADNQMGDNCMAEASDAEAVLFSISRIMNEVMAGASKEEEKECLNIVGWLINRSQQRWSKEAQDRDS